MKNFEKCVSKRLKNSEEVFTWMINNTKTMQQHEEFDAPNYAGMPNKLNSKLSGWIVDLIQDDWDKIRKNKSMKYLVDNLIFVGWSN